MIFFVLSEICLYCITFNIGQEVQAETSYSLFGFLTYTWKPRVQFSDSEIGFSTCRALLQKSNSVENLRVLTENLTAPRRENC